MARDDCADVDWGFRMSEEAMEIVGMQTVKCFMDGIDWQHHLDSDSKGTRLFPSVLALERAEPHLEDGGCGIVEVEVRLVRWVRPQDLKTGEA